MQNPYTCRDFAVLHLIKVTLKSDFNSHSVLQTCTGKLYKYMYNGDMQNSTENNTTSSEHLKIERCNSLEETQVSAVKYLNDLLSHYVDRPVLLLLAGGSSMELYNRINPEYLSTNLTVTVTDDRFSEELDVNNFAILQSTSFYNDLIDVDAFCINTQPNAGETLEECALRFEKNLKEWKSDFPKGIVIAVYGVGADGHTGGMVPGVLSKADFDSKFNSENVWVSPINAEGKIEHPLRFSTTIPFMKNIVDHALFYVTGEKKKEILNTLLSEKKEYFEVPAVVMKDMKDVTLFTDVRA